MQNFLSHLLTLGKQVACGRCFLAIGMLSAGLVIGWFSAMRMLPAQGEIYSSETRLWVDKQLKPIQLSYVLRNRQTGVLVNKTEFNWRWASDRWPRMGTSGEVEKTVSNSDVPGDFCGSSFDPSFSEVEARWGKEWLADIADQPINTALKKFERDDKEHTAPKAQQ